MTTGNRLKQPRGFATLLFSATLWCVVGTAIGWYVGQAGGYRRGMDTAIRVLTIISSKPEEPAWDHIPPPRKYTDL